VSQNDVCQTVAFLLTGDETVAMFWSVSTRGQNQALRINQNLLGANNIQWLRYLADGERVLAIDHQGSR